MKKPGLTAAVEGFLDGLQLEGAQKPVAQVALLLAESLEEAPRYARARLARELRDVLGELTTQADQSEEMWGRRAKRERENAVLEERRRVRAAAEQNGQG